MIEIKNLKIEKDGSYIINDVSVTVENKRIFGVLCADSMQRELFGKVLCGAVDATDGEVMYDGKKMTRAALELKAKVRLASYTFVADGHVTVFEYLDVVGNSLKLETEKKYRQIKEALELTGLDSLQNKLICNISDAYIRFKVSLAASLLGNPDYIISDCTFDGFSDDALSEIYELLEMLGNIKTIVLFSDKPTCIKRLCQNIAIISRGKVVLEGHIDEIEQKINSTHELRITVRGNEQTIHETIKNTECVVNVKTLSADKNNTHLLSVEHYPDDKIKDRIFEALSAVNCPMLSVKQISLTLNDVYYSLISHDQNNDPPTSDSTAEKKNIFRRRKRS